MQRQLTINIPSQLFHDFRSLSPVAVRKRLLQIMEMKVNASKAEGMYKKLQASVPLKVVKKRIRPQDRWTITNAA